MEGTNVTKRMKITMPTTIAPQMTATKIIHQRLHFELSSVKTPLRVVPTVEDLDAETLLQVDPVMLTRNDESEKSAQSPDAPSRVMRDWS